MREMEQQYQQRLQQIQQENEATRRQLQALVGVQPQQTSQADQVKQQFFQLFPNAKNLFEKAETLEKLAERLPDLEEQQNHYWGAYGRQALGQLFSTAEQTLGGPLNDVGRNHLRNAFISYLQSDPQLAMRYAEDPSIVTDFWKEFSSGLIDPVRRTATAQVVQRVPQHLPQDSAGSGVPMQQGPRPGNMDERAAQAWSILENFRANR